jgi:uncharacterized hydrophobic protein (TIGR00341 family)
MKVIEVIADAGHLDTIRSLAEQHGVRNLWWGAEDDTGRRSVRLLVDSDARQAVLDALQGMFSGSEHARILVLPVEAVLPREEDDAVQRASRGSGTTREELYEGIAKGARLDGSYLLLVILSTVVAAIGLIEDNVAVVIGAMVIAPLLGPNLSLALASALGDLDLMWSSLRTALTGVLLALVLSVAIGWLWPAEVMSRELMSRTDVGLDGLALALAAGAAAVLSLTTGVPTVLVGVMVAVALLPPTATMGLMLGTGRTDLALGAGLLLAVNIVCVNLAAKVVLLVRGVKPRSWYEKRKARQSVTIYIVLWVVSLAVLMLVAYLRGGDLLGY